MRARERVATGLIVLAIVVGFVGLLLVLTKLNYPFNFGMPVIDTRGMEEIIHDLGVNTIDQYRLVRVDKGERGENRIAVFANRENGQKIVATLIREHLGDRLERIALLDRTSVEETFYQSDFEMLQVPSFRFTYFLPLMHRNDDLTGIGDEAVVRGISIASQERLETDHAEIFYVQGEFTRIGLFKEARGEWVYPTPAFDFVSRHEGALAFLKSRASGRVVIYVGVNSIGQFIEQEFREFVTKATPK